MKDAVVKTYGKKGEKVINQNFAAIDKGIENVKEVIVPASWANVEVTSVKELVECDNEFLKEYVEDVLIPSNKQKGDDIPVSTFAKFVDGTLPQGTAAFEKRGTAVDVPEWIPENCIQCTQCSYVCPHAVIRPFALNDAELAAAPAGFKSKKMAGKGTEGLSYSIDVSVLDCTGCGSCVNVCPAKNKALVMKPLESQIEQAKSYDYAFKNVSEKELPFAINSIKGSQFKQPLLEFSGACGGCGETPYAKLVTQLFGDRMYIANAKGCSSIWGGSAPSTPYTVNKQGKGPAWANSLFEDNAEYGYGMFLAVAQRREKLSDVVSKLAAMEMPAEWGLKEACEEWLAGKMDAAASKAASEKLLKALDIAIKECGSCGCEADELYKYVKDNADMLIKKSMWIFGGDGQML
jgi:pyruvate-ferredoxin/flavodoxin oxidoreductase